MLANLLARPGWDVRPSCLLTPVVDVVFGDGGLWNYEIMELGDYENASHPFPQSHNGSFPYFHNLIMRYVSGACNPSGLTDANAK